MLFFGEGEEEALEELLLRPCYNFVTIFCAKKGETRVKRYFVVLLFAVFMQKCVSSLIRNSHILSTFLPCVLPGTRTLDPLIKSQLLYQLS